MSVYHKLRGCHLVGGACLLACVLWVSACTVQPRDDGEVYSSGSVSSGDVRDDSGKNSGAIQSAYANESKNSTGVELPIEGYSSQSDSKISIYQLERLLQLSLKNSGVHLRYRPTAIVLVFPAERLFESPSTYTLGELEVKLKEVVALIARSWYVRVSVDGHVAQSTQVTDTRADSLHLAEAVASEFLNSSIDANTVSVRAFGDLSPIAANDNPGGRRRNRRVEVSIWFTP